MKSFLFASVQAEKHPWLWLIWAVILLSLGNASTPFWDQDEAAYAAFGYEMEETGDFLTQDFTWAEIHRKPPWHTWTIAVSYRLLGVNEFAARFPSVLALLSLGFLLWFGGRKRMGAPLAALTVVLLSFSFFVPVLGKIALTDGWLLLWETMAFLALWQVMQTETKLSPLVFWLAIMMGVLTKGPAILLTVGMVCFLILLLHPERKRIWRLHPWFGLPLALLPLLGWGYLAWQQDDGAMISWMIDWYILKRTGGTVLGQSGPPGYFLLTLCVAFLPFVRRLPPALAAWWKRVRQLEAEALLFLAWIAGSWWLWELIPSKLPAYAIGVHPIIAILIAREMLDPSFVAPIWHKIGHILQGTFTLLLAIGLVAGAFYLLPPLAGFFALIAAIALLGTWLGPLLRKEYGLHVYHLVLLGVFWLVLLGSLLPYVNQLRNTPPQMALELSQTVRPEAEIVLANRTGRPPSVPFYLRQHFPQVSENYRLDALIEAYQSDTPTVLVLSPAQHADMKQVLPNLPDGHRYALFSSDRIQGNTYVVLLNSAAKR